MTGYLADPIHPRASRRRRSHGFAGASIPNAVHHLYMMHFIDTPMNVNFQILEKYEWMR